MIGRALEQLGPGPWWEYIAKVVTRDDALHQAATLARIHGVNAWWHRRGDEYTPIDQDAILSAASKRPAPGSKA